MTRSWAMGPNQSSFHRKEKHESEHPPCRCGHACYALFNGAPRSERRPSSSYLDTGVEGCKQPSRVEVQPVSLASSLVCRDKTLC